MKLRAHRVLYESGAEPRPPHGHGGGSTPPPRPPSPPTPSRADVKNQMKTFITGHLTTLDLAPVENRLPPL